MDGTNEVNLTNRPEKDDEYPVWSPDGERIAFVCDGCIQILDLGTGSIRQLSDQAQFSNGATAPCGWPPTRPRPCSRTVG